MIIVNGYYLVERTDDSKVTGVTANEIYSGVMGNIGEVLELRDLRGVLIDNVDVWHRGDNISKVTMERID